MNKGKGKRRRVTRATPPPGFDWDNTKTRFCAKMAEIHSDKPTGEVLTPETAYAKMCKFVKEDLHLSVSDIFYCDHDHHLTNLLIWC